MKFSKTIALALAAGVVASAAFAEEEAAPVAVQEEGPSFGAYAGTVYKSGYLSNGTLIYDDWVFQSYAGITFAGFDFNFWNSADPSEDYGSCGASEIDWELDYANSIGDWDYSLGVATWTYPCTDKWDDEWVGKVAFGYNGWLVRPEVNARFGLESQQGCYGQFKLSKGFEIADGLSAGVYGLVGYASKSWRAKKGDDDDGFVDFEAGARIGYELCSNASIAVGCQYSTIIDGTLRDNVDAGSFWQDDGDADHFLWYVGADIWF